jgi:hypothetical protein
MKDWIEQNINPPGIREKNRGSLFSAIGKVFDIVKKDAETAFKAHFPYLADERKLAQHGKALSIPRLEHDTEQDYRERVAAASFYLMRAGERSYIIEQFTTHFGVDNYLLWDEFLHIFVKIYNSSDIDRMWAYSLLDRIVNPNVAFSVIDWLRFIEEIQYYDTQSVELRRAERDIYPAGLRCNGRILCDQGVENLCDGSRLCDGSVSCQRFIPTLGTVLHTVKLAEFCDGSRRCDGAVACAGYSEQPATETVSLPVLAGGALIDDCAVGMSLAPMEDKARIAALCDGTILCDGTNRRAIADAPMTFRITAHYRCDGKRAVSCTPCDGSFICDGSQVCFDGWYCAGDIPQEEVV